MKYILLVLACCTMLAACRKKAVCKGNCVDITISGRVYDIVSNKGFADVTLQVNWFYGRWCLFCPPSYEVANQTTSADGTFNFIVSVDTSFFGKDYVLSLRLPVPNGCLDVVGHGYRDAQMFSYSPTDLQNLQFGFYPKTEMDIQLHRVLTDSIQSMIVQYSYDHATTVVPYITSILPRSDTTIHCFTASGNMTTVELSKRSPSGVYTRIKDSLFCTATGPNIINIYY